MLWWNRSQEGRGGVEGAFPPKLPVPGAAGTSCHSAWQVWQGRIQAQSLSQNARLETKRCQQGKGKGAAVPTQLTVLPTSLDPKLSILCSTAKRFQPVRGASAELQSSCPLEARRGGAAGSAGRRPRGFQPARPTRCLRAPSRHRNVSTCLFCPSLLGKHLLQGYLQQGRGKAGARLESCKGLRGGACSRAFVPRC